MSLTRHTRDQTLHALVGFVSVVIATQVQLMTESTLEGCKITDGLVCAPPLFVFTDFTSDSATRRRNVTSNL
jgi:hypothetical protein